MEKKAAVLTYHVYVLLLHLGISFQPVGTCCKAMKKNKQALPDSKQREQNSHRDEKSFCCGMSSVDSQLAVESQCDSDVTGRNLRDKRERGKVITWSPGTFLFGTVWWTS
jgi:hypothetical protein